MAERTGIFKGVRDPATRTLVVLNVGLALGDGFFGGQLLLIFGTRGFDVYHGEWWRILSGGFMHHDLLHIAMNSVALWFIGRILEPALGMRRFLAVYFVSLLGGSALALTFQDPAVNLAGASGAIYGLLGAVLGYLYGREGSWRGVWALSSGRFLVIILGINVAISVQMPEISLLGHLGGLIPGTLLGFYFEQEYRRRLDVWHKAALALVLATIVGLAVYACLPFNRPGYLGIRAMSAWEAGDWQRGDELLARAKEKNRGKHEGVRKLLTHLSLWRSGAIYGGRYSSLDKLRAPLVHSEGWGRPTQRLFLKPREPRPARKPAKDTDPVETPANGP